VAPSLCVDQPDCLVHIVWLLFSALQELVFVFSAAVSVSYHVAFAPPAASSQRRSSRKRPSIYVLPGVLRRGLVV